ncbi:MAG: AMP-binding protein [Candidatus Levybacteria bacterium]|nr:AMP-binding protein [Candidatus Levybacteria bacterium]
MKTLIDLFELLRKRKNQEIFVYRTGVRRFTFTSREIFDLSLRMADYLRGEGIKKDDKVAIWAPNSPFWAVAYFGILLVGGIVVPIDFTSGKKRAETILKLSGAKFIIQSFYKFERVTGLKTAIIEDLNFRLKFFNPIKKFVQADISDIAEIVYTSGTTGDPKGVVLTHENIVENILSAISHIELPRNFNFLSVLPLSHMLEQTVGFLTPLYRGDKIIYLRTIKPSSIMEAFKKENVYAMLVVPRFLSLLKNTIEKELASKKLENLLRMPFFGKIIASSIHKKFGTNFQMFIAGGAALPLDVFNFWKELGFKVIEGYGLTECSPIVSANTFEKQIAGSVGKPLSGVRIKLDNQELLVKGKNVFTNYYQNPTATEKAFKNGWFRTGDFVMQDREGNIFIKGRKKDVIVNASGINIYPEEIENVLNKTEGVKESCVVGLDKGEGEGVHAVLILNNHMKPSIIVQLANQKLDPLQRIESFSVWNEYDFPRTTTLKIQKFKVKERLLSENREGKQDSSGDTLITLIANVSKKTEAEIKEDSVLVSDLGMNSLSRLELVNYLEQEYRVDLEDTVINQNTTVSDLRKLLEKREKTKKQRGLWLWLNNPVGRAIREAIDIVFQKPLSNLFFDLKVHGLSNLESIKRPAVFISNHVSYLDQPAIMYSLPRNIRYKIASATREEFFFSREGTPLFNKILFPYSMIAFNTFLLPQKSGFRKSLSFMGSLIDQGVSILIFPEGTRTKNGKLGPFMQGLGLLTKELQVPIVPIKILGMEKIYPRGSKFPKKGKCQVVFGKPIEFTAETPSEIIEISRNAILNLSPN